jgi:DNA polymerase III epsilon subunit-like protein
MIVFDTETTGLPDFKNLSKYNRFGLNYYGYPEIVQLAWLEYDNITHNMHYEDHIIRIHSDIPKDVQKIHGITNEIMREKGENPRQVLKLFIDAIERNEIYVAHNAQFDIKMILAACEKYRMDCPFQKEEILENVYCTKKEGTNKCKIMVRNKNGRLYMKWPRLFELHEYLFPSSSEVENFHNALTDVVCTFRCAYMIINNIDICLINKNVAELFKRCSWKGYD